MHEGFFTRVEFGGRTRQFRLASIFHLRVFQFPASADHIFQDDVPKAKTYFVVPLVILILAIVCVYNQLEKYIPPHTVFGLVQVDGFASSINGDGLE
jgi:hypothetical protein